MSGTLTFTEFRLPGECERQVTSVLNQTHRRGKNGRTKVQFGKVEGLESPGGGAKDLPEEAARSIKLVNWKAEGQGYARYFEDSCIGSSRVGSSLRRGTGGFPARWAASGMACFVGDAPNGAAT